MKRILSLIALLLLAPASQAAPTSIANLPLLNIDGTGTVKPNLMLLYDNSGSMASTFTPDYVDDTGSCRSRGTLASGTRGCRIGDPPFASADFNKQYYNPKVRYLPPVRDTGVSFDSMTRQKTTNWTQVPADAFGINKTDLLGQGQTMIDLTQGFPDLAWCDTSSANCVKNELGYSYPSDTRYTPVYFLANPYYYNINVGEYCTDATLTDCRVTTVGGAAPAGYPVAAPLRWCNSRALTTCQAKYVGAYKYPRFSDPNRVPDWYGSITVRASTTSNRTRIKTVEAITPAGSITLTSTAVFADNGTDTAAEQGGRRERTGRVDRGQARQAVHGLRAHADRARRAGLLELRHFAGQRRHRGGGADHLQRHDMHAGQRRQPRRRRPGRRCRRHGDRAPDHLRPRQQRQAYRTVLAAAGQHPAAEHENHLRQQRQRQWRGDCACREDRHQRHHPRVCRQHREQSAGLRRCARHHPVPRELPGRTVPARPSRSAPSPATAT
ncbi:hypothetical protein [Massilia sp. Dwa41.01b]|uniref:hypothetical protein n=1 Tax=Massilia sp. Dwa41.01b TaxID=2709302 RepID=UPI001E61902C|nr:hypothetical protein [Massilia sp. Dwa41.01b]